jgi:GT2 family glycosyltransferase
MTLPSLSIIIPTYNGRHFLEPCLRSVRAHAPGSTQVIIVDDASTDDTAAWMKANYPEMELVQLSRNLGFCGVVNTGLEHACGDVVELLNNDTEVSPGWAAACLKHFEDPAVGSVAPLVTRMDDRNIIDSLGQDFHICGWAFNRGYGRPLRGQDLATREVFGASGSCGFYRREALQKTGGLWPIYGFYFEDTDLAFRLRWAGYRCIYEPASRVAHQGSGTTDEILSTRKIRLLSRNEEIVFWANVPLRDLVLGAIPHMGFLAVRLARKILKGQWRAFLSGKIDALRAFPNIWRRRKDTRAIARRHVPVVSSSLSRNAAIFFQGVRWLRQRAV